MRFLLLAAYVLCAVLNLILSILGWPVLVETVLPGSFWRTPGVIPIATSLVVLVLPIYLNPPKQLSRWLSRDQ
jgi:hypothetical protein